MTFQFQHLRQVKKFVFISLFVPFGACIRLQYFFDVMRNKIQAVGI